MDDNAVNFAPNLGKDEQIVAEMGPSLALYCAKHDRYNIKTMVGHYSTKDTPWTQ